jgi:hypothetical protein
MAHKHSPQFLKLVEDSMTRIREIELCSKNFSRRLAFT